MQGNLPLIVIADRHTRRSELRRLGVHESEALIFDSLEELDRWRAAPPRPRMIAPDVDRALAEIGCSASDLQPEIHAAVQRIAHCDAVPQVHELFGALSERTFYRRWSECVPLSPKQFLARVQLLHARRLLEEHGYSSKEAAFRAGYRSTWHLNQALSGRNRLDVAGNRVAASALATHVVGN